MKSLPGTCPAGYRPCGFRPDSGRCAPRRGDERRGNGPIPALEKKRREDARIAALIREDKELSLAQRRGELIPAADVQARLGAGALAIRQGMEATRRAVLAAATKGCRKAVAAALDAGNRNLLEGTKSAMGSGE